MELIQFHWYITSNRLRLRCHNWTWSLIFKHLILGKSWYSGQTNLHSFDMSAPDLSASLTAMDWLPRLSAGGAMNNISHSTYVLDAPKVIISKIHFLFFHLGSSNWQVIVEFDYKGYDTFISEMLC